MSEFPEIGLFLEKAQVKNYLSKQEILSRVISDFSLLPYENITKIIRLSQTSDLTMARRYPSEVLSDHYRWQTGGTCFSLTYTLRQILRALDFEPEFMMADMKVGSNVHCALRINLHGRDYLLDPGYLFNQPIQLPEAETVSILTPMNRIELEPQLEHQSYDIFVIRNNQKKWRYRLKLASVEDHQFFHHWDESFSMNMMNSLTLSRITRSGQLYFSRNRMQIVTRERRQTKNVRHSEPDTIREYFDIEPAIVKTALEILTRKR